MSTTSTHASHAAEKLAGRACQIITALSMTAGRGPFARVADAARPTSADRVVDLGCGPAPP